MEKDDLPFQIKVEKKTKKKTDFIDPQLRVFFFTDSTMEEDKLEQRWGEGGFATREVSRHIVSKVPDAITSQSRGN